MGDVAAGESVRPITTWRALARAMARRCPRCGQKKLFRRWLTVSEQCPRCGLRFEREEGAFLGSLAINYAVTAVVAFAFATVILVATMPHPPVALLTAGTVGVAVVVPLLFYPFAKTLWAAIDLLMHRNRRT